MMLAPLVHALAASAGFAGDACQAIPDGMLRLACYQESPIPAPCEADSGNPAVQLLCIDRARGRPIQPKSPEDAWQCRVLLPDREAVLACYATALPAPLPPPPLPGPTGTRPSEWTVQVREQGLPKLSKLNEPAQIGYKHENQRSDPIVKAAVVVDGPTLGFVRNWNWLGSLDVNLDLSAPAKQRANSKTLGVGARGIVFDLAEKGFALDSTIRLTAKDDAEAHTRSSGAVVGNLLLLRGWIDGGPGQAGQFPFQVVPSFGLSREELRKVEAGKPEGAYSSAYVGVNAAAWPSALPRTQVNVRLQRFVDLSASGGLSERYVNYKSFGIDYYLYDPAKESPLFTPRLALVREIGDDPLTATVGKNRTLLVFKFTLD